MSVIGEPIPEYLLDAIKNHAVAVPHAYECKTCRGFWRTLEVPIYSDWSGLKADCCPVHHTVQSRVKMVATCRQIDNGKTQGPAIELARSMGATYRRRQCEIDECYDRGTMRAKRRGSSRTKWTTLEVLANGRVCNDVRECPRCVGGYGVVLKGSKMANALQLLVRAGGR